jgi:signal transduction histidine kinase
LIVYFKRSQRFQTRPEGWLQRAPPDLTQIRKETESIIEAGTLALEIIDRLRSLYKKSPPKRELVAINELVGEMARLLRGEARSHGVSIRTNLKDDLPMTVADRVQLQQVLMNRSALPCQWPPRKQILPWMPRDSAFSRGGARARSASFDA